MEIIGRILLVEDDPKDTELTMTALEEYNLSNEVVVATDGEEALDYLYYRGIKGDENLKMIPVVVLTSSREEQDMVRSYKLGVNAYVVKPVDFHEFVNAIKELGVFWAIINEPPPGSIRRK